MRVVKIGTENIPSGTQLRVTFDWDPLDHIEEINGGGGLGGCMRYGGNGYYYTPGLAVGATTPPLTATRKGAGVIAATVTVSESNLRSTSFIIPG